MIKDKLLIYAKEEDKKHILELVLGCAEKSDMNVVSLVAVADGEAFEAVLSEDVRCVIVPHGFKQTFPESVRKITYCENGTSGDISALNVQQRETCTCFEVLYGVFMSRVFIPKESKFTVKQVLLCVCVMCGFGVSVDKLIPLLNELLK